MNTDYDCLIDTKVEHILDSVKSRVTAEEFTLIKKAYDFAKMAHAPQKRRSGEPYIIHPVEVAQICAIELMLDVNTIVTAFLHDVVEDTEYTLEDIKREFGEDVAFLVNALTKQKKEHYEMSKQVDNYKQMLDSMHYDIRAILIKVADRLNNMRTLNSMPTRKQMKIAGETDYFYAPLANRLGLYSVKMELENLSMRYRCPQEYSQMVEALECDKKNNSESLEKFTSKVQSIVQENGVNVRIEVQYRMPYSIWRKMQQTGTDFKHTEYRHFVRIVFPNDTGISEKSMALRIYSLLTDNFKEKPGSICNYIDSPKENGYQSFHVKLLSEDGEWQEVHISSEHMIHNSRFWCVADNTARKHNRWVDKFKNILKDIAYNHTQGFMDNVVTTFYNDDIVVYTPKGKPINLPKGASALDFAFEVHTEIGEHAHYARVNGKLCSVKTRLKRGDCVEIGVSKSISPRADWIEHVHTYKARHCINAAISPKTDDVERCKHCHPLPGEEVIGFRNSDGVMTIHKRDCAIAIRQSSQHGDSIEDTTLLEDPNKMYPVRLNIKAVDRFHLLSDIIDMITNKLELPMQSINTYAEDEIAECEICLMLHSITELEKIIDHINSIDGVDEVRRTTLK